MRALAAAAALAAALAVPAAARAQAPSPQRVTLSASRVLHAGAKPVAVKGRAFLVAGTVAPYAPGETVTVRTLRRGHELHRRTVAVRPGTAGTGTFALKATGRGTGPLVVRAGSGAAKAPALRLAIVGTSARPGSRGVLVSAVQQSLAALHYVVPRSGVLDAATLRAVLAWRKVAGERRIESLSGPVVTGLLAGRGAFRVRHPHDGRHVEARLNTQVLALIDGSRVRRIYTTSSGKPSTPTIRGRFRVYRREPGTNGHGMVDSDYFSGGYAVHGYASVPPYAASHGCLRVPIPDARSIYDWLALGDVVWVEP